MLSDRFESRWIADGPSLPIKFVSDRLSLTAEEVGCGRSGDFAAALVDFDAGIAGQCELSDLPGF
jgi:hypothetical protein